MGYLFMFSVNCLELSNIIVCFIFKIAFVFLGIYTCLLVLVLFWWWLSEELLVNDLII